MALVYKVHIQGGSDNTAPFPHNHPYISSCKLQLEISTAATYVGMIMWEWCCVLLYVQVCIHIVNLAAATPVHGELPCRVSSAYSKLHLYTASEDNAGLQCQFRNATSNTFLGALTTTDLQPHARLDGITFTVEGKQTSLVHLTFTSDPLAERIGISCCAPSKYNYSFSCAECNVKLQGRNEFIDYQSLLVIYFYLSFISSPSIIYSELAPLSPTTHVLLSWLPPSADPLCVKYLVVNVTSKHNSGHRQLHFPVARIT